MNDCQKRMGEASGKGRITVEFFILLYYNIKD